MAYSIARYTAQLVILVTPEVSKQLRKMAKQRRVSIGEIARELIDLGLAQLDDDAA